MYAREFGLNWRSLLAGAIGMAFGSAMSHYLVNLFGPALIAEFGWSTADFALVGTLPLMLIVMLPLAGRFTDRFGARIAATVGFTAVPLGFLAFSMMGGSIVQFFAILVIQLGFGVLTTSLVFARVIVERFDRARGFALSLMMGGFPLVSAVLVPLLGEFIHEHGWRAGYQLLAAISGGAGVVAILLMGRTTPDAAKKSSDVRLTREELAAVVRNPIFLLILGGMLLVNVPQVFAQSQIKLVMLDNGMSDGAATWAISLYAIGMIAGRFISGLALDRLAAHVVAISALALPAIGFVILATPMTALWGLALAVFIIGAAGGAEGDIVPFIISRHFDLKNYSLILSCVTAMIAVGGAIGSSMLSYTLHEIGSYRPFLLTAAVATVAGALLFFLTGRRKPAPMSSHGRKNMIDQDLEVRG